MHSLSTVLLIAAVTLQSFVSAVPLPLSDEQSIQQLEDEPGVTPLDFVFPPPSVASTVNAEGSQVLAAIEPGIGQQGGESINETFSGPVTAATPCGVPGLSFADFNASLPTTVVPGVDTSLNVTAVALADSVSFDDFAFSLNDAADQVSFTNMTVIGKTPNIATAVGNFSNIEVALPANFNCTGGPNEDLCLLRGVIKGNANCIVLQRISAAEEAAFNAPPAFPLGRRAWPF